MHGFQVSLRIWIGSIRISVFQILKKSHSDIIKNQVGFKWIFFGFPDHFFGYRYYS